MTTIQMELGLGILTEKNPNLAQETREGCLAGSGLPSPCDGSATHQLCDFGRLLKAVLRLPHLSNGDPGSWSMSLP